MRIFIAPICLCAVFTCTTISQAEDWPMWRFDAGRTAVSTTELPESLELNWVRHLPPLTPAFHNPRLQFDAGYEPIVASGQLLIASSRTDSVTAYDTATGDETWSFHTNGPIRCAPAVWNESVCFGSDDGYLYCLELKTGKLRWKFRAVPSDRRLLGNQRLISVWPIRGGPVVDDGKVYFAAGVWPFEGVFIYSLDIESGKQIWRNDRLGYLFGQQPHNTQAIGGVAPQGYLLINDDELIVPCSTAYPARLNLATGDLIEFELPSPGRLPGGWFASIDKSSAKDIRRGKLTFDDVVNRQLHEDKIHKGRGDSGVSRVIHTGEQSFFFDDKLKGVEGTIHSIIAANDQLFVSTREGLIYCFGAADSTQVQKLKQWQHSVTDLMANPQAGQSAKKLIAESTGPHGYAFVVGLNDGSLVKALLQESQFHVIAVDDNHARVQQLRHELIQAGLYGTRAAVIECGLHQVALPPYIATILTTETPERVASLQKEFLQALRPFGGIAAFQNSGLSNEEIGKSLQSLKPGNFEVADTDGQILIRRVGALPGSANYAGNWELNSDELVRFPMGVVWFDDTLAHFKRSPQPVFTDGVMISRPKNWHAPRGAGGNKTDYPLLRPVLSDMYTGRVLDASEESKLRAQFPETDPTKSEPSQYRPPRQKNDWSPKQPVVGQRTNPLTGKTEPRTFPKTYGCDGGVDYGQFFTLRSGTAAFYDKTIESGTVFLSGPRSGCTNSIIPAGGLLNVPYFFEGCTCSYPLPTAMSLVAMPESHEQWSAWGESEIKPKSIQRIGLNFGAPGDRMTRDGTLWLDFPSVGGPSPKIRVESSPENLTYRYHHSVWMKGDHSRPWVAASAVQGLQKLTLRDLKPGRYTVRLYFAEPDNVNAGERVQTISFQGEPVLSNFDIHAEAGGAMIGVVHQVKDIEINDSLTLDLSTQKGDSLISGVEIIRQANE